MTEPDEDPRELRRKIAELERKVELLMQHFPAGDIRAGAGDRDRVGLTAGRRRPPVHIDHGELGEHGAVDQLHEAEVVTSRTRQVSGV